MKIIKDNLKDLIGAGSIEEVNKITGTVMKEACLRMKPGKADVSGSYTSSVFLNSPDLLFEELASIFRSYLIHGNVTLQLLSCAFLPLCKKGIKNPSLSSSYRTIAASSQLLKLFEYVILVLWGPSLDSDSMQFGFKRGVSTTTCSWMVMEVTGYFLRKGTPCIVTLLDCTQAFDKCLFDQLFQKLIDKSLPHNVVRVLVFIY